MKQILMVTRPICPPWDEASKNFAFELSQNIEGQHFHLLTCGKLKNLKPQTTVHPIYSSPALRMSWKEKLRLLAFLLKLPENIDALHFLFTPSPLTTFIVKCVILPKAARNKKIKTIQTVATLDFKRINCKNVREYLFADFIVTHSEYSQAFLREKGLVNARVIRPGIDLAKFRKAAPDEALKQELGIDPHDRVLLYTGEYVRLGATDRIVEALPEIVRKVPNVKLIFAMRIKSDADIQKRTEVKQKIKAMGLQANVIYLETFSDMAKLYNIADVFLFPVSNMSGKFDIALTVLEAMASSLPVVMSDIQPLKEACQIPDCARKDTFDDPKKLAASVVEVLQNEDLANKLGTNARANVEQHFNIIDRANDYEKLYQEINLAQ